MTTPGQGRLLVLGLGNVLCSDDGLGVVAVERLRQRYELPADVELMDGGTLGLTLLTHLRGFDDVILVDAIRGDGPPGTLVRLEGDEVAPAARHRLSVHQVGVADLLDALRLLDAYPRRLILLGLVPETLKLELARSPAVEREIPRLVERVLEEIHDLGYGPALRQSNVGTPVGNKAPATRALGL